MKFVVAAYGVRGDVEPSVAVGRELLRRGHVVRTAVPPDLVGFAESVGLAPVAYGPDARKWQDLHRDFTTHMFRNFWKIRDVVRLAREDWQRFAQSWREMSTALVVSSVTMRSAVSDMPTSRHSHVTWRVQARAQPGAVGTAPRSRTARGGRPGGG